MRPVRESIDVPVPREQVYDFLDVLANHEPFMDHMLTDWRYSGTERGVGSKARVTATAVGRSDTIDIETMSADPPAKITERNVGAGGRRIANGTYLLEELSAERTRIVFEYSWQDAPLSERLSAPIVRAGMRRGIARGLQRLAEQLTA